MFRWEVMHSFWSSHFVDIWCVETTSMPNQTRNLNCMHLKTLYHVVFFKYLPPKMDYINEGMLGIFALLRGLGRSGKARSINTLANHQKEVRPYGIYVKFSWSEFLRGFPKCLPLNSSFPWWTWNMSTKQSLALWIVESMLVDMFCVHQRTLLFKWSW